jgi:GlcNAc-P-P-Und epimerase
LITGANGFLGGHIARAWREADADVTTLGRSRGNDIVCDLRTTSPDFANRMFDTIIHCAGKAHSVPRRNADVNDFFRTNVEGTKNLLRSLAELTQKPERVIFISSVAVYGKDEGVDIEETAPLNGTTPYAKSKVQAEEAVKKWAEGNRAAYFNLRPALVVGADAPGNFGSLVAGIRRGRYIRVADNKAKKSLVLAEDVAKLTLTLDRESGAYNLTDRVDPKFCEIESAIADSYGKRLRWQIPRAFLKVACGIGSVAGLPLNNDLYRKVTSSLTFSSDLAVKKLGWHPASCLDFIRSGGLKPSN